MAEAKATVGASQLTHKITMRVHVRGMRRWQWRLHVAAVFFRLAAWIAGLGGVEVTDDRQ